MGNGLDDGGGLMQSAGLVGGRRSPRTLLPAVAAALAVVLAGVWGDAAASGAATARAASTLSLNDTGHLHRTSGHGITINQQLNEQGSASGTIAGTIYIHLRVVSTNRVTAEVSIYPSGGSITGNASASFRSAGATASFNGTLNVERGTGHYNNAHGSGLSFSGTIQRVNDAITVHVTGRMST
jgi:hypothetical protein